MLVHQQLGTSACRLDPDCLLFIIQSIQWLSRVRLCNPMDCSTPGLPVHHKLQELAELMSIKSVMPSNHLCCPFSCLQSFPASGSLPMSQLFTSCGQSIRASVSTSVFPVNIQGWFLLGLTGLISLQSKGLSRVFSNTTVQKYQFLWQSAFFMVQFSHPYMTNGKTIAFTRRTFVSKVRCLCFLICCLGLS